MAKKGGFLNSMFKIGKAVSKDIKAANKEREKAERAKAAAARAAERDARAQARRTDSFESWGITTERVFDFSGECERKVVVYDGEPLAGLREGEVFELRPFLGDAKMFSRFSDYVHSTKDGDVALMYQGTPVGFCSLPVKEVKALAKKGVSISVKGVCNGDLAGYKGIKDIVAMTKFDRLFANDVLELIAIGDLGAPEYCPVLDYNEYDEDDFMEIATRKYWLFKDARLEIVQPERKTAKPRVVIMSGKKMVSKVEPKNKTYYDEMMAIAESGEKVVVSATRCEGSGDKSYYHISVYHW